MKKKNNTYNDRGFSKKGFHQYTGTKYDRSGLDVNGLPKPTTILKTTNTGFNTGVITTAKPEFNSAGYNIDGFNKYGRDRHGCNLDGYNDQGYDKFGRDKFGFDSLGFNEFGRDKFGYDQLGVNSFG